MMTSMSMSHILNDMKYKLANDSWWWLFGQNTGQNFENDSFLEEETFKLVSRCNNEGKIKLELASYFSHFLIKPELHFIPAALIAKS